MKRVLYPSLASHPDHAFATKQMRGFGGVVSFEVHGGLHAGAQFVDLCRLPHIAPSLGGVDSLVEQPTVRGAPRPQPRPFLRGGCGGGEQASWGALTGAALRRAQIISYWNVEPEERRSYGIEDGLIRFACGVEDTEDIVNDVLNALDETDINKQYLKDSHAVRCAPPRSSSRRPRRSPVKGLTHAMAAAQDWVIKG